MNRTFEELDAEVRALGYGTECLVKCEPRHAWRVKIAGRPFTVSWVSAHHVWMCWSDERRNGNALRAIPDLRAALWSAVIEEAGDAEQRLAIAQIECEAAQLEFDTLRAELARLERGVESWDWSGHRGHAD